ncbi:IS66 family insertion sequence element accessory protein TnpB [Bacillus chungangensis]|uniref:Uncharacterized protein n=1 Tax=Bacillus chungangensis TaxID=587633 RepID=A0ABT9WR16_9BACI|nr:IS66 family insertion sequence element accessory protein TnpB [Bacillus chungangensis]MDQ0175655.1 hypothetical protein [Bacillus chungangensis]
MDIHRRTSLARNTICPIRDEGVERTMIHEATIGRIYLAQGATNLRKSIDGLVAIVKEEFNLDPFLSVCLL